MGDVLTLRRKPDQEARSARAGMLIFLSAWAMMFGGLLFTFVFVRVQADVWPPPDLPPVPVGLLFASSLVLVGASALIELGRFAIRRNRSRALAWSWLGAGVFAVGFLVLQALFFFESRRLGMKGAYGALFLTFIFFHAITVVAGLPAVGVVVRRAFAGRYGALEHLGVRLWAVYWVFVTIVWLSMFAAGYPG